MAKSFAAGCLSIHTAAAAGDTWGTTSVTGALNAEIAQGTRGVYTGGRGVLVRNPFDGFSDDASKAVLPATFWVNDIFSVSQMYPNGDPRHPMHDGEYDPWDHVSMGFVIGSAMPRIFEEWDWVQEPDWGHGVFYPYDSNSVDQRCRWLPDKNMYDCPGGVIPWDGTFIKKDDARGAGGYLAGNPVENPKAGGGSGCHWDGSHNRPVINQYDGNNGYDKLVNSRNCECSYSFKAEAYHKTDNGWTTWVERFHQTGMGGHKVYSTFGDLAACWVNNPRDMINMQNALWWSRSTWNDGLQPQADFFNSDDYIHWRRYWGWNEVPVSHEEVQNPLNWDAVVMLLPAGVCRNGLDTADCLSTDAQNVLQKQFAGWESAGYIRVGFTYADQRPGSYVVFARQILDQLGNYQIQFFCQNWSSNGGKYKVVWMPITKDNERGACYVEYANVEMNTTAPKMPSSTTQVVGNTSNTKQADDREQLRNFLHGFVDWLV